MKTITFLFLVSLISLNSFSQSTIESAYYLKEYTEQKIIPPPLGTKAQAGPDYGCLSPFINRPTWFFFTICGKEYPNFNAEINLGGFDYSSSLNFDTIGLIIWGPFDDTINIASKL